MGLIEAGDKAMNLLGIFSPRLFSAKLAVRPWPRHCESTSWTVVLAARDGDGDGEISAQAARGELFQRYYYPVYAYIASSRGPREAEELTQAYFVERIFEGKAFESFDPLRCTRFRAYLFSSVNHFLSNRWKSERRLKRDVRKTIAFDCDAAEIRFLREPSAEPERRFNRACAISVLRAALEETRVRELDSSRKTPEVAERCFSVLKGYLQTAELDGFTEEVSYAEAAKELALSVDAVTQKVRRLRELFVETLRSHVRGLVSSDDEVESELRFLREALAMPAQGYERSLQ